MHGLLIGDARGGALLQGLHTRHDTLSRDYLHAARRALDDMVQRPDLFDGVRLERKPGGYARNLLAGDEQVGIWAMVWSPGAITSIHDHHCSCCFGVVSGAVRETWFRAVSATHAVPSEVHDRAPGYVACMLPSGPNIHRMENVGDREAISIHIYGFDHQMHASSVDTEFQLAAS